MIEHEKGSDNTIVSDYDINMDDTIIRINKLKTDDFKSIYESLSDLQLPISAMDVRKVQNIVKDIYSGGNIKVSITEDLDSLKNEDRILAIGSHKTIKYEFQTAKEMISNYFKIIEEANVQLLSLIDKLSINSSQYFPMFGFDKINPRIKNSAQLKDNQINNIENTLKNIPDLFKKNHNKIEDIFNDDTIANSNKAKAILWETMNDNISLDDIEEYLRKSDLNILEVGCACGGTLLEINNINKTANIYGIEINSNSAKLAKNFANVSSANIEDSNLPYKQGFFDYIIFGDVLEHLYNPQKVLENIKPYLKEDGKIIASIPNIQHWSIIEELLKKEFKNV